MRVVVGDLALDLTDAQVNDLRDQLGVSEISDSGMLTTAQAAERLGFSPEYVRDHAAELGGVKLSAGPKAPWRFPVDVGNFPSSGATDDAPVRDRTLARRRAPRRAGTGGQLLQSRGR